MSSSRIWRPYTQEKTAPPAIRIAKAKGSYIYSEYGQKIFDGVSSWWLITHGHCQPEIVEAIQKQSAKIDQVLFANFSHKPAEELAELLLEITPPSLNRVFLSDNGSTAVEVALKMALQSCAQRGKPSKTKFLGFAGAYHGDTVGAMSIGGVNAFTKPYRKALFEVLTANHPTDLTADILDWTKDFERIIRIHHEQVAAVILEPLIQGAGGMIFWPESAVRKIAVLCQELGVYLIFDEVMTGFGRTGQTFAMDKVGVAPDLLCLSKGLTGGALPLAVTMAGEEIYQSFLSDSRNKMLFHGHSFTGNPISCAAAVANIKLFKKEITTERLYEIENAQIASLTRIQKKFLLKNVRVCGTIGAIDLQTDNPGYLNEISKLLTDHCLKDGHFIRPLGSTIYVMPPYCSTPKEVEDCWLAIGEALHRYSN
jgi:adenosylmethionine-8-amino-7-oxononanoate aminotransferase